VTTRFRVRCRDCGRTVLSGVERIGVDETHVLGAHLEACRFDLAESQKRALANDLGAVLAHFDVENARV
jgi:hypothetical protein